MLILKSQKSEIHNCISNTGLEPSMFEWKEARSRCSGIGRISQLSYIKTDYFFKFDFHANGGHWCAFSPGINSRFSEKYSQKWDNQLMSVRRWLLCLKSKIETVDPWDDIDKYMPGVEINLEDEKENSPFSYEQVEHITNTLHKLKDEIKKSYDLDTEQDKLVQEKLDYLIDRSKKVGRKDWKILFVGIIVALTVDLVLDPEEVKGLWGLVKSCFKGILLLGGIESG